MECYFVSSKHICEVLKNVSDILSCVKPNKKGGGGMLGWLLLHQGGAFD